jgi:selenocysteine lyase/cysteine desulfurase
MLRTALGEIPSVTVLTPPEHAGLVSFRVANVAAEDAVRLLGSKGFLVRSIPGWDAIRVSCGFFLQEEEIERVASEVAVLGR